MLAVTGNVDNLFVWSMIGFGSVLMYNSVWTQFGLLSPVKAPTHTSKLVGN